MGDHRWWISDLGRVPGATTRTGSREYDLSAILREIHDQNAERWSAGLVRLSVVIPARDEEGSIGDDRARSSPPSCERAGIDYEIIVVDDAQHRRHRRRGGRDRRLATGDRALHPLALQRRLRASPCGPASRRFEGDAVAIVMADGSDDPQDLVRYHQLLEEGYDCAFGSRFLPGSRGHRLPAAQAGDEPGRELRASACCSGTATTTRPTPSRRTAAR